VTWAVWCFWTELALGVPQFILQLSSDREIRQYLVGTLVTIGILSVLQAWVIYKISTRRNWARYVSLVATVLSALMGLGDSGNMGLGALTICVIGLLLDCAALFLLFTRPGKDWFKSRQAS
jgi:choline-glycine betaine transporter